MQAAYLHGVCEGGVTLKLPDKPLRALDEATICFVCHKLAHVPRDGALNTGIAHDTRVEVCFSLASLSCTLKAKMSR